MPASAMRWCGLLVAASLAAAGGCAGTANRIPVVNRLVRDNSDTLLMMAQVRERQGRLGDAREIYEDVTPHQDGYARSIHRLAIVHARLGEHEQADAYFLQAIELDPNNADILADQGYSLYLRGDLDAARIPLRKALQLVPKHEHALNQLGLVEGLQGNYDESLALFRRTGSEANAQANLAYVYMQNGDAFHAEQHYARALTLDPELKSAGDALVQIASLKDAHAVQMGIPSEPGGVMLAGHSAAKKLPVAASPRKPSHDLNAVFVTSDAASNADRTGSDESAVGESIGASEVLKVSHRVSEDESASAVITSGASTSEPDAEPAPLPDSSTTAIEQPGTPRSSVSSAVAHTTRPASATEGNEFSSAPPASTRFRVPASGAATVSARQLIDGQVQRQFDPARSESEPAWSTSFNRPTARTVNHR